MGIEVAASTQKAVGPLLSGLLDGATKFQMASAYVTQSGLDTLEPFVERILERDGEVHILHGADCQVTDPASIKRLANLNLSHERMFYRVRPSLYGSSGAIFHPKMYICRNSSGCYTSVVGSSNATRSGLYENIEVNVVINGIECDSAISQSLGAFNALANDTNLIEPWSEWVAKYEELYRQSHALSPDSVRDGQLTSLFDELQNLTPQTPLWVPSTQRECIVYALQSLDRISTSSDGWTLTEIYAETRKVARMYGLTNYKWDTFTNSIRGRIYSELDRQESLLSKVDNATYALSLVGRKYRGSNNP